MVENTRLVVPALLLALAIVGGSYLIMQGDYAPKVNVSDISTYPNIYVSSIPPDHMISVSATSSEKVTPDLLIIQLKVVTEDTNAKDSQEENADVMEELKAELKTLGVPDNEVKSSSYSVQPITRSEKRCDSYGTCNWHSVVTGYRTIHAITLSLTNLSLGGDVLDGATGVGTNQTFVDYVQFTLQDETRRSVEKSLLKEAALEATDKAGEIAKGLNATLGKPLAASESIYYPSYQYIYRTDYALEAGAPSAPSTELSAGEMEVSATVSASYEIA